MYPIIALWSHPRSMSTALERVMRERKDLDCAHEPFMYYFYVGQNTREMPHFKVDKDHPVTYESVRDMLLERAERRPVFFKDMSYCVMPRIIEDRDFCLHLTNCFLIRNPLASISSYYKLDPEVTLTEIGIEAQWNHYSALGKISEDISVILQAEEIRADARKAMRGFWEKIGLDYCEEAFNWDTNNPEDWKHVSGWHKDVSSSNMIRKLTDEEENLQEEKFNTLACDHPHLNDYFNHHYPFYLRLRDCAFEQ